MNFFFFILSRMCRDGPEKRAIFKKNYIYVYGWTGKERYIKKYMYMYVLLP